MAAAEHAQMAVTSGDSVSVVGFAENGERPVSKWGQHDGKRTIRKKTRAQTRERSGSVPVIACNCLRFFNDENRSNFRKSLGQLASNMRKIDATERTSPSNASASVSPTAVKTPWRTRGRAMFFLLRTAF